MVRLLRDGEAGVWAAMRARLWPDADPAELANEARAFVAGDEVLGIAAVFIATGDGGEPIGFLELGLRPYADGCDASPVPFVEGWFVEERARAGGHGRDLIRAAEDWSRERGFVELASDALLENESSQRAHERCGFVEVERTVRYRRAL